MRTIEKASGQQAGLAASGMRERNGEGGTSPFSLPDPARRPPAFSIVRTDREPGTGCFQCSDTQSTTLAVSEIETSSSIRCMIVIPKYGEPLLSDHPRGNEL